MRPGGEALLLFVQGSAFPAIASRLLCQRVTWMDGLEFFQSLSSVIMMAKMSSICQGPLIHVVTAVLGGGGGFITNKTLELLFLKPA